MQRRTWTPSVCMSIVLFFFFSSRRRHTRLQGDWSSDVCSSDLAAMNVRFERLALTTLVMPEGRLDFGAAAGFQRHIEEVLAGAATASAAVIIDRKSVV